MPNFFSTEKKLHNGLNVESISPAYSSVTREPTISNAVKPLFPANTMGNQGVLLSGKIADLQFKNTTYRYKNAKNFKSWTDNDFMQHRLI